MREPSAWRIDKAKRAATSFDGRGASIDGGRWNSAGVRMVYASAHLAMATQEKYVHLPKPVPPGMTFVKFRLEFGRIETKRLKVPDLPADWQSFPPSPRTQKIGDAWVLSGESAILAVPSALIPEEENYLLNPGHPNFRSILIHPPEPFVFPSRLARLRE